MAEGQGDEKLEKLRRAARIYYSRKDIQQAIADFSKSRETVPCYGGEGFGKRPDTIEYPNEIQNLVLKGATSFHCSEELWSNPLELSTEMSEEEMTGLREGWDLILDVDSKFLDYSRITAELLIEALHFHNIYSIGIKYSGNKGFHIGIPFSAFPSKLNNIDVKKFFPEGPRIIQGYLNEMISKHLQERIANLDIKESGFKVYDLDAAKKVMPDLILASPRHLFRAPYSLHDKTGLVSCVITEQQLKNFKPGIANPDAVEVRQFMPKAKENEARELLVQALDWAKKTTAKKPISEKTYSVIKDVSATCYPPCIQNILKGIKQDGRKRGLFVTLNFFKSLNLGNEEIERKIQEWNKLNAKPLKQGYILSQLSWFSKHKAMLPPNCDKPHYKDIAVCCPDPMCGKVKNPVNYAVLKARLSEPKPKKQKNFK